jgi:Fur family transcriptional regulator, zinc uptake regulator
MKETNEQYMIRQMESSGLRITNQRKSLASLFAAPPQSYTAAEVYNRLEKKHRGLSYSTVYRNLRTLQELGVLDQMVLEDGMKFSFNRIAKHQHHHNIVCLSCGTVLPLEYCPMKEVECMLPQFRITHHRFEIFGYCQACEDDGSIKT